MIASIDVTGIKYEVDQKTLRYVTQKIGKLDRYVPTHARKSMTADIKLKQVNKEFNNKYEAEVILNVPNKVITAADTTLNMMAAIDIVESKLIAQLTKYKDTLIAKKVAATH